MSGVHGETAAEARRLLDGVDAGTLHPAKRTVRLARAVVALAEKPVVTDLDDLEAAVETACQAIYMQREGYWPSDMERHHIAIALLSQFGSDRQAAT